MRVTHQLMYALYGLYELAHHAGPEPLCIQEIGERQAIPGRYLEQIFQRLRRAGLVESKRGPGGGYVLARPPQAITLAEIVRAVDGAVLETPSEGEVQVDRPTFIWERVRADLTEAFGRRTLAHVCAEATRRGRGTEGAAGADGGYEI